MGGVRVPGGQDTPKRAPRANIGLILRTQARRGHFQGIRRVASLDRLTAASEIAPAVRGEPIPPVRDDLELQRLRSGKVEIRDPFLLQILVVDAEDLAIAQAFDGVHDSAGVEKQLLEEDQIKVRRSEVERVAREWSDLHLLDVPSVWTTAPIQDNVSPPSQLGSKRLNVLPVAEAGVSWKCHGCGACCHGFHVELTQEEEARIDPSLYQDILKGEDFFEIVFLNADEPAKHVLRQIEEESARCIFLAENGLCHVHSRQGMEFKPNACQAFPLVIVAVPDAPPRLSLRSNCQSMYKSFEGGPPLSDLAEHAVRVHTHELIHSAPAQAVYFGATLSFAKIDALFGEIRAFLTEEGVTQASLRTLDRMYLGGRAARRRKAFGAKVLSYVREESEGDGYMTSGAYADLVSRTKRGKRALQLMAEGQPAPEVRPEVSRFLAHQIGVVLHRLGPLHVPDAGIGLTGIILATEAALHAVGRRGTPADANIAFEVFTHPLIETTSHAWPILDAIDRRWAKRVRKEMSS
jgi:Fe-S-cluster containining protein